MMNKTRRKKLDTVLTYVVLILLAAFIVVPVLDAVHGIQDRGADLLSEPEVASGSVLAGIFS